MSVEIRLMGKAAVQAQTLVAELMAEGADVRPLDGVGIEKDRDITSLASDIVVGLVVEATASAVRAAVARWRARHEIEASDVSLDEHVTAASPPDDDADVPGDDPESSEPHPA